MGSLAWLAGGWGQAWGQDHNIPRRPQPHALSSPAQAPVGSSKPCLCHTSLRPVVPRDLLPSTSARGCSPASGPAEGNEGGGGDSALTERGLKESGSGCVSAVLPAGGRREAIHVRAPQGRRCRARPVPLLPLPAGLSPLAGRQELASSRAEASGQDINRKSRPRDARGAGQRAFLSRLRAPRGSPCSLLPAPRAGADQGDRTGTRRWHGGAAGWAVPIPQAGKQRQGAPGSGQQGATGQAALGRHCPHQPGISGVSSSLRSREGAHRRGWLSAKQTGPRPLSAKPRFGEGSRKLRREGSR